MLPSAPAAADRIRAFADTRQPLDATALSRMVLLTALWGFQQVAIKLAAAEVSLLLQAGIRSGVATLLVGAGIVLVNLRRG
ncbi:MAG: hypothetical protein O2975_07500 [Proteobacteria bacterium]|nr:hypothetical protein [Pseudomonadota bacterium]